MNPISSFLVRNIVAVFFFYGLAFFSLGLALALAGRRASKSKFARAIPAFAGFGIVHGSHEWFEMFQKIAAFTSGHVPTIVEEAIRLVVLAVSFLMLSAFGMLLLRPDPTERRRVYLPLLGMASLWILSTLAGLALFELSADDVIILADTLARYCLGIPGALLGAWALMLQQRTFRQQGMPKFGRDLVWCATALLLYGVAGQLFVRPSPLAISTTLNSTVFLRWFGIPVQLFRAIMATTLAVFMVQALNAFDLETKRQVAEANEARLRAQAAALDAERRVTQETERLNEKLRLRTQELSLLLDLSNLMVAPISLPDRLNSVLEEIVHSLGFPDAGAILLSSGQTGAMQVQASTGFTRSGNSDDQEKQCARAVELAERCVANGLILCRHLDGSVFEFSPEELPERAECPDYRSPAVTVAVSLAPHQRVIGSIVLDQTEHRETQGLTVDEFVLVLGVAQQLGLSIENALLHLEAKEREKRLAELLREIVGAQEAERQRIARELHDATGQSLTAVALGLRSVEKLLVTDPSSVSRQQVQELISFSTDALGELRQIIEDLRPSQLDDLGLVAALQWYAQQFERRYEISTNLSVEGRRIRLPSEFETVLFRVTQEALTNVAKHSRASRADVVLEISPTRAQVTIKDNGRGFDPAETIQRDQPAGWGLVGIQERALLLGGECEIESKPGSGTCIRVSVPLVAEAEGVQEDTAATG